MQGSGSISIGTELENVLLLARGAMDGNTGKFANTVYELYLLVCLKNIDNHNSIRVLKTHKKYINKLALMSEWKHLEIFNTISL